MMPTKIVKCTCKHDNQDRWYGVGCRVANEMGRSGLLRCTVCGAVYGGGSSSRLAHIAKEPMKQQKRSPKKAVKGRGPKAMHDRKWGKK